MLATLLVISAVCKYWVFSPDFHKHWYKTHKQNQFELWLEVESLIVWSQIVGGVFYLLLYQVWRPPTLTVSRDIMKK